MLGRRSAASRLLRLRVRIKLGEWSLSVWILCVVWWMSLRRADHSCRGLLPSAWVWLGGTANSAPTVSRQKMTNWERKERFWDTTETVCVFKFEIMWNIWISMPIDGYWGTGFHGGLVLWHHDIASSQITDGGDILQIWPLAAQTLHTDTPHAIITYRNVRCKSNFAQIGLRFTYCQNTSMYVESRWKPNSITLELDRPQRDRPTASVIAQQYSSVTIIPLRFHSSWEKFGAHLKN
jgi:hypothetical protein